MCVVRDEGIIIIFSPLLGILFCVPIAGSGVIAPVTRCQCGWTTCIATDIRDTKHYTNDTNNNRRLGFNILTRKSRALLQIKIYKINVL